MKERRIQKGSIVILQKEKIVAVIKINKYEKSERRGKEKRGRIRGEEAGIC